MKIILGLTGSVATTLAPKIAKAIAESTTQFSGSPAEVVCVMTERAECFMPADELSGGANVRVFTEKDEWTWGRTSVDQNGKYNLPDSKRWIKGDSVLHVDIGRNAAALVIAPSTINTIAKMANGICDNLLLSIYFALPRARPVIIAPAANSNMWFSKANQANIATLRNRGVIVVPPVEKKLACGDFGMGALADIPDIAREIAGTLEWNWPFQDYHCPGIPVGSHPGAYGAFRKHGKRHCGVDLYTKKGSLVYPVEDGIVVAVDGFTGASVGSPWWNETKAVKIEGASGVVCYGEIEPLSLRVGDCISRGNPIGYVTPVLMDGQLRPDIPGHSLSMLHMQLYTHGMIHKDESWLSDCEHPPTGVLDPTPFLLGAFIQELPKLDMPECKEGVHHD